MDDKSSSGSITIEGYLKGKVGFNVSDDMVSVVLSDREILPGTSITEIDQKNRDLLLSDLLYLAILIPSKIGSEEESDGGWKHKDAQVEFSATDKKIMLQRANELRTKWGLQKIGLNKVVIRSYGIQRSTKWRV